jgi:uncharacterized protein (TIGR00255 family)
MILGMTGYGRGQREQSGLSVAAEIRTVNHRFADVQLRMPRTLAALEPELRRSIGQRLGRGRADVFVRLEYPQGRPCRVEINDSLVTGLVEASTRLREDLGVKGALDLATVLRFPEAVSTRTGQDEPDDQAHGLVREAIDVALAAVQAMRAAEGALIVSDLEPRLARVEELRQAIEQRAAVVPDEARRRLEQRLEELIPQGAGLAPGRLEAEVALLADRSDITEELVRLAGYVQQTRELLTNSRDDVNGRRFDFLLQELNREVNTIGSKAGDSSIGTDVVELKQELERIREQVQNVV